MNAPPPPRDARHDEEEVRRYMARFPDANIDGVRRAVAARKPRPVEAPKPEQPKSAAQTQAEDRAIMAAFGIGVDPESESPQRRRLRAESLERDPERKPGRKPARPAPKGPKRDLPAKVKRAMDKGDKRELRTLGKNGGIRSGFARRQSTIVRDRQIAVMLARGTKQTTIARRVGIAQSTVAYLHKRDLSLVAAEGRLLLRRGVARRFQRPQDRQYRRSLYSSSIRPPETFGLSSSDISKVEGELRAMEWRMKGVLQSTLDKEKAHGK